MSSGQVDLIRVEDLRKAFGSAEAIKGVSFAVPESALVVIIGPSGCGKSTLLRCLNGLELLDSGRVRIGGVTLERHDGQFPRDLKTRLRGLRREVGMVFQSFNLFPHMTVLENVVKAPVAVKGMSRAQAVRRIVLPQAVRRILPVLASTWVSLFKDTSLVSVIAVSELAYVAMQIRAQTFRVLEMLTAMAAVYWLLGYPQAKLVDWIQRRYAVTE